MSIHSIYNQALEHHQPFNRTITERLMTAEEMAGFGVSEFKPARDSGGKVIQPPSFTPYSTTPAKATKPKERKHRPYVDQWPHVTKEFIATELASGKKLFKIGEENGMSRALIFYRAEKYGLHTPKEQIRGAGKYEGK